MDKWIVSNKIDVAVYDHKIDEWEHSDYEKSSPELVKKALKDGEVEAEIAVLRKSNTHGLESYGWDDQDKIILFDNIQFNSREEIEWAKKVAKTIADALNEKGL